MKNAIMLVNTLPRLDYWDVTKEPQLGMPTGLLSIGSVLCEKGYKVKIVDPVVDRDYFDIIKNGLDECLYVGISAMTAGIASGIRISQFVRRLNPSVPIVWGGIHPTLLPEQTLANENVDFIVWGEGERTCLDIAEALRKGRDLATIEGLGNKTKGRCVINKRKNFLQRDELPFLGYDLLNMDKYVYRELSTLTGVYGKVKAFVLNTGIGCPYKCTFCINTHPSQRYRPKSIKRLMVEVERMVSGFAPEVVHFQDDLFFADKYRVFEFFDEYERRGYRFRWFALTRANYFRDDYLSDDFIKRIRNSCLWLGLGIESGSDAIRKRLKKEINEEQINRAVETLARNRIPTGYAFMVGMPHETRQDMVATVKLIRKIKKHHPEAGFAYQVFRPYPGTELFDEAVKLGYKMPQSLAEWSFLQDVGTGYTDVDEAMWIQNKDMVKYFFDAVQLLQYPSTIAKGGLRKSLLSLLVILFLKFPYSISLRFRLATNFWKFIKENDYHRFLEKLYGKAR